jgi:hypothetical protein
MKYILYHIIAICLVCTCMSCSHSKKFSHTYYQENDSLFRSIRSQYKQLYEERPFSVGVKDKSFRHMTFEILTDTIKYVYEFETSEPRFIDTLVKYRFDVDGITHLLNDMQRIHVTWITNLDYYEKMEKKYLVFISIRHKKLKTFMRSEKYFTLALFDEKQYYDAKGRLLDREDARRFHRINGGLFRRINDNVFYSMSLHFR